MNKLEGADPTHMGLLLSKVVVHVEGLNRFEEIDLDMLNYT